MYIPEEIRIERLQKKLDYTFVKRELAFEALQMPGYELSEYWGQYYTDGNKRLALIGNAVLQLLLISDGYERGLSDGAMHNCAANPDGDKCLADHGFFKSLNELMVPDDEEVTHELMSAGLKAIMGAVYLDSNKSTEAVETAMRSLASSFH